MRMSLRWLSPAILLVALAILYVGTLPEQEKLPVESWSFSGPFGTFDRAGAQRGFQVYQQVCSNCHSMDLGYYRNLEGIGFSAAQVKAIAHAASIPDLGPDGQPADRPALPSDHFRAPFANELAARAANGGALPPDQSVLEKARENGPDYIFGILTGYRPAPPGVKMGQGLYYNEYFPGHQIAMPQPLQPDQMTYADGTKATLDQEAHDVVTFLTYMSNPEMEARKRMGVKVVLFLVFMTIIAYFIKRQIWSDVH